MNKILTLLFCLMIALNISAESKNLDSLYRRLDDAIHQSDKYVAIRESRIASAHYLRGLALNAR